MQTCTKCFSQSSDDTYLCQNCGADLREFSTTAMDLKKMIANPRVLSIRINIDDNACSTCQKYQATYPKNEVPRLPIEGCSNPDGCKCSYSPILDEIYP
ncbi:MAG: hypothetical protein ABFD29_04335 [Anaerolineaceae bacterium]|jgi:hypothetical protein